MRRSAIKSLARLVARWALALYAAQAIAGFVAGAYVGARLALG